MAGKLQSVGFSDLIFGPIVVDYGTKGCTTHFNVTCATIGPLVNYYNYIVTFGASGTFHGLDTGLDGTTGAEMKMLSVSLPGLVNNLGAIISELYFDQWELLTNETSDTIFNNPLMISGTFPILNYNSQVILSDMALNGGTVQAAIDRSNANRTTASPPGPLAPPSPAQGGDGSGQFTASTFSAAQVQLAKEVIKQQTEFGRPTYVLRHTSYCSARATYNTSIAHTMEIYTPAQLLTECGSGWIYNLPTRLYSKISSIPVQVAATDEAPYYIWGWLKKITREPVMANFVVEINTEYELALWSNLKYQIHT